MEKAKIEESIRLNNAGEAAETGKIEKKKVSKNKKDKVSSFPNLQQLLNTLEDANRQPAAALDHLSGLAADADELISKIYMVEQHFAPGQDDEQIEENMLTFMQSA